MVHVFECMGPVTVMLADVHDNSAQRYMVCAWGYLLHMKFSDTLYQKPNNRMVLPYRMYLCSKTRAGVQSALQVQLHMSIFGISGGNVNNPCHGTPLALTVGTSFACLPVATCAKMFVHGASGL